MYSLLQFQMGDCAVNFQEKIPFIYKHSESGLLIFFQRF